MSQQHDSHDGPPWFTSGKNLIIVALAIVSLVQGYLLFSKSPSPELDFGSKTEQTQGATPEAASENSQAVATPETDASEQSGVSSGSPGSQVEKQGVSDQAPDQVAASSEEQSVEPSAEQEATVTEPAEVLNTVSVTAVTLEDTLRRYLLISFDKPLGEDLVGKIPQTAPADLTPEEPGTWSWISPFTLRYDFQEPLEAGSDLWVYIRPDNLLPEGMEFSGDENFALKTEAFQIAEMELYEDYDQSDPGKVVLKGNIEFTYPVDPWTLLDKLRLTGPEDGKPEEISLTMDTTYTTRWLEFRSAPMVKDEKGRMLTVTLKPGLVDAAGSLVLDETKTWQYDLKLDPNLHARKAEAASSLDGANIRIAFSAPVDARAVGPFVHVSPEAEYSLSRSEMDLVLTGDFKPGQEYVVTLDRGLAAADGSVLREDWKETLYIPDLEPSVAFRDSGIFLPLQGTRNLAVESVNAPKAEMFIDRVYRNNIFLLLQDYSMNTLFEERGYTYTLQHYMGDRIVEETLNLSAPKNEVQHETFDVARFVEGKGKGLYRIFLGATDSWEGSQRWVLVTDMGVVAKKGKDDLLVWVNSFSSLSPVAGVKLQLLSDQQQLMAEGVSDANGIWHAKGLAKAFEEHTPYMIVAEKGDDYSFLLLDRFGIDPAGQDVGGQYMPESGYLAYVYGERDIYRPGENMEGVALLRRTDLGTPPAMPLTLLQKDPQGKVLSKRVVESDAQGVASFSYDIPTFALTGNYSLEVLAADTVIGTYNYKVEEFLPDRIKVEIAPEKATFSPGEKIEYAVSSRYFFGPPASELPVESTVKLQAAPFAPSGWEGYEFGDPDGGFDARELQASEPDSRLNEEGERSFSVELPEDLRPPAALEAMLFARVSERGGRGVGAMQRVSIYPYPRYTGLKRLEDRGVDPGSKVDVEYVVLTPDGKPTKGAELRVDFYKDVWQTVLRRTPSGGFRYDSVRDSMLVSSNTLNNAAATGSVTVSPPEYGSYRVVLVDEGGGAVSQTQFYAGGWGYSPWAIKNPARMDIVPDKDEYAPGESATLQVRTPFAGKLLLTVEGDEVFDTKVVTLEKGENTATLEMPIREAYSPNVYVTGVLVRSAKGLEPGAPARAFGSAPLFVDRNTNDIPLAIDVPAEIRPETTLDVTVSAPPESVVTIAAVDEGILQLIAQATPDPFPMFYAKRALGTESYDIFSMLFPDVPAVEGTALAGGDQGLDRLRQFVRSEGLRRVEPVAFWTGPLVADASGKVQASFDVPEFQGALRVMAVMNKGRRFGSDHALTRVRSPLIVTPTLPRFLSPDDEILVPVTLRNDTDKDGAFSLQLDVTGNAAIDVPEATLDVPKGKERLAYFTVKVGEETEGLRFVCSASGNNEKAAATVNVPVRPALPARTASASGSMDKQEASLALNATGLRPETIRREVYIGGQPLVRFTQGLESLLGYPYGCVEQTTSKVFPLLYWEALAQALSPKSLDGHQPDAMVQSGIARLLTMQLNDGGFSMWPGGDDPWPWGSLYATHFLLDARLAGHHVPESVLNQALQYVASLLRWKKKPNRSDLQRMCYAHFVLAKAGKPDRGGMDYMRKHYTQKLSPMGAALLAGAYGLLGDIGRMEQVLNAPAAPATKYTQTGGDLDSPIRNTAIRLTALLEVAPEDAKVAKLVQELTSLMEATPYRSTQENGLAYVALGRFYALQQKKAPFSGEVYLGDEKLGSFSSEDAFHKLEIEGDAALRIVVTSDNFEPGSVFYSVLTRGVPTDAAYSPYTQGISIERAYLTRDGKELPSSGIKQGDLIVLRTRIKADERPIDNVVLQALLPAGLEVENPRLETTERLPWAEKTGTKPNYQDLRDDRVLLFLSLPGPSRGAQNSLAKNEKWQTYYSVLRAVTPGSFALPPVQAEAMYDPSLLAAGAMGSINVLPDDPEAVLQPLETPASSKVSADAPTESAPAAGEAQETGGEDGSAPAAQ